MTDFTKPYQAPPPSSGPATAQPYSPGPTGPAQAAPESGSAAYYQNLNFGGKFVLAFKLTINNAIYYVLPMLLTGLASLFTLGIAGVPMKVGLVGAVLRQVDGDSEPPRLGELFEPFNRFGPMFFLWLIFFGLGIAIFIFMFFMNLLGAIPLIGILFAILSMFISLAIRFAMTTLQSVSFCYLAEHDDTAANTFSLAFKLLKEQLAHWASAYVSMLIVYIPLIIVWCICVFIALIPVFAAIDRNSNNPGAAFTGGVIIFLLLLGLILLVISFFIGLFTMFLYAVNYRQCYYGSMPVKMMNALD